MELPPAFPWSLPRKPFPPRDRPFPLPLDPPHASPPPRLPFVPPSPFPSFSTGGVPTNDFQSAAPRRLLVSPHCMAVLLHHLTLTALLLGPLSSSCLGFLPTARSRRSNVVRGSLGSPAVDPNPHACSLSPGSAPCSFFPL
ncbi:hypothetical protein HPB50_018651 [Hyalomma asiaticum]|uniref:Uncharacterized protein n=1 Tax=Hyalomma asiaticum TaxID=266040 RepID=A0ACB7SGX8_HYAAI|nr:hypothetical protein HPB50_018651 [Hyalomma asiaticum]